MGNIFTKKPKPADSAPPAAQATPAEQAPVEQAPVPTGLPVVQEEAEVRLQTKNAKILVEHIPLQICHENNDSRVEWVLTKIFGIQFQKDHEQGSIIMLLIRH